MIVAIGIKPKPPQLTMRAEMLLAWEKEKDLGLSYDCVCVCGAGVQVLWPFDVRPFKSLENEKRMPGRWVGG